MPITAVRDLGEAFLGALGAAFALVLTFLPKLIGALIILLIGWFIAGLLAKLVTGILRKVRFNQAADKAGLSKFIHASGIQKDASSVMGEVVNWFFRIITLIAAFDVLQLPALTSALQGILGFIPKLFVALIIILIGGLIATLVSDLVRGATSSAGMSSSGAIANVARYAILFVAIIAALSEIGIAATIVNTLFIATVGALALAMGIAFGLGGRDVASRIWQSGYDNAQKSMPRLSAAAQQQIQPSGALPSANYTAASIQTTNAPAGQLQSPATNPPVSSSQPQGGYYDPNTDPRLDPNARR